MEDVLAQRVTPILKCMVLFLFIFTAKVFTSRPQDSDYKNSIHQHKPSYYVRTFTKYHHRRTIQWNSIHDSGYWPEHPTVKRSVNYERIKRSNLIGTANNIYQLHSDSVKLNTIDGSTSKEGADVVKEVEPKSSSTTSLPIKQNKTCLYKIHSVTMSVTPDYADDKKADMVVENEIFGCWRFPHSDARNDCDKCTRVTARLPGTKFCCCTKSFCNADFTSLREETVTIKAESTMESASTEPNYSSVAAAAILALVAILLMAIVFRKVYCTRALYKDEVSDGVDLEKGDIMGSGPDALATGQDTNTTHDIDKNSNCLAQNGDVTAPLLYTHPHMGRNACIERNTNTHTHTVELIHKSLKDIAVVPEPKPQLECLSVARVTSNRFQNQENSDRMNEIRSYQRPLDYVQNDVSDCERAPKQTNLNHEQKDKWGLRKFLERRLNRTKETEVKLVNDVTNNGRIRTSVIEKAVSFDRPSNLNIQERPYYETTSTMSPPNRTLSPNMLIESEMNTAFRELPSDERNQVFAVIVPKVIDLNQNKTNSSDSLNKKSIRTSLSSQSIKAGQSESEDSTLKKRLSCDNRILTNSAGSSRASINLELQYLPNQTVNYNIDSPFDVNSDCSSSEDEHLMLLSENGGAKITMHTISKDEKQNEVLKESSQTTDRFNRFQNKYTNFDNEFSDPHDKENLVNGYSGDNPVYIATINGEIDSAELKIVANETNENGDSSRSPKPRLKNLTIKRQHSLEQVSDIFSSSSDISLQNPAGRVKTPGDLPVAVRRARRDRALQKGRASECNRLSLYDDRMMFGNSL
ncbi:unnamed protein product [Leptidea sinapis]|uniref:Uncharacterized protein n=1 Tax=Leptidea sinapis TaxID=189913 RepID=A0A5E4PXN3_9NEOP|nr:unnamed protein product [Leptidea sinapis]